MTRPPRIDLAAEVARQRSRELHNLADEFARISRAQSDPLDAEKWTHDAGTLRFTAMLALHNPGDPQSDSVARGFIDAARQKVAAEIAAVHESRARRREASTAYEPDAGGIRINQLEASAILDRKSGDSGND